MVAHSGLVTTDMAATLLIFGSMYGLWRWSQGFDWRDGLLAAGCFGLAFTAKFSAILLIPPMVVLSAVVTTRAAIHGRRMQARRTVLLLIGCAATAYLAVWAAFGFRYSAVAPPQDDIRLPVEATLELGGRVHVTLGGQPPPLALDAVRAQPGRVHGLPGFEQLGQLPIFW